MSSAAYRDAITQYVRANAQPPDKFSHQPRLYRLASQLAQTQPHDDDVLYAGAWLHDLGVFIGHRPANPAELVSWDCVAYAIHETPALLESFGFPKTKIPYVVEVIRTHQPHCEPTTFEGTVLRDADILEQLGAVGILRTVSKVGRDTRFVLFSDALRVLKNNLEQLPGKLRLDQARHLAQPRIKALQAFLSAAEAEAQDIAW
jgi:uncharacterized protein